MIQRPGEVGEENLTSQYVTRGLVCWRGAGDVAVEMKRKGVKEVSGHIFLYEGRS